MDTIYTDEDIENLIKERKPLPENFVSNIQFKPKLSHKEYDYDLKGDKGNNFRLILRQNSIISLDFSIILGYVPANTNRIFRLRRYNGKSHEHRNRIEKHRFYDFHIHTATERYQRIGDKEDTYAEPSHRFVDFHSALKCMLGDCNFVIL